MKDVVDNNVAENDMAERTVLEGKNYDVFAMREKQKNLPAKGLGFETPFIFLPAAPYSRLV